MGEIERLRLKAEYHLKMSEGLSKHNTEKSVFYNRLNKEKAQHYLLLLAMQESYILKTTFYERSKKY